MNRKLFEQAKIKLAELVNAWGKANVYMVGGCVRDIVMGLPPKDIDLCIDLPDGATEFCNYLKKNHSECCKNFVVYPRFGTSKFSLVLKDNIELDIECVMPRTETYNSGPRKPDSVAYTSLDIDATRRDFCCNALYMNVCNDEIIDPTGRGKDDIKNKILKTPLDPIATFTDDPLRMLRAVRFAWQKGFTIDDEVEAGITDYPEYYQLSMERVRDEFTKILLTSDPSGAIWFLHNHDLLEYIIPELEAAWGFNQNNHHHSMNLTDHILKVLDGCKKEKDITLRMAALLHDISKYKIYKIKENGEFTFHRHELDSADMCEAIMKRLRFSDDEVEKTCFLIRNHMCIKPFYDKATGKYNRGGATTRKIVRLLGDALKNEMTLIEADNLAHAPGSQMPGQVKSFWEEYDKEVVCWREKIIQPVSGKEIMSELGIQPGKLIGEIKEIFQTWVDSDPELTKEKLFELYHKEFSGKTIWVSRWLDHYNISENPQKPNSCGYLNPDPYEVVLEIPESDLPEGLIPPKKAIELKASEYPILYKRWTAHKKFREALKKLDPILSEIESIPGSGRLSLYLDKGDLSGCMEWEGFAPEYVM